MSEKIQSSYYPERGRVEPYNTDGLENNAPPKVDNAMFTGEPYNEVFQPEWMFADAPIVIQRHWNEMQTEARERKMRKVIAHLNRKPSKISGDTLCYLVVIVGLSWFIGRALWQWLT